MNALNYGSIKACQRLVDAGIVQDTDFYFKKFDGQIDFISREEKGSWLKQVEKGYASPLAIFIPAPSMAEVWRELPEGCELWKDRYTHAANGPQGCETFDSNPTDALIDLLIWVRRVH